MNYGEIMKKIRESNDITQSEMAQILNISRSTYGHYEVEYQIIPLEHLINFCNYFGISIDFMFSLTKNYVCENINHKIDKILIGMRLKEFRKERKLTQEKLATILNTTKTVICGYEKGRYLIATPFLYDLCKKYKISADYLLGRVDDPKYLK